MSYIALYRKYRSKNFDELVGQDAIKITLLNSLKNEKVSHAYLFCGPRGTGKTSVARLFAKALNCQQGQGNICNSCTDCEAINNGSHPDVIEIDAASNSGVDEVRNLIEKVRYTPIQGKKKVYIIDEVHMMTNSAFNALLKTIEEPPDYCVFILCTTEPYKLLPTILSRCQRYDFKKIADNDLKKLLTTVLAKEKVSCEPAALDLIVELSNGGARDSLSLLDQIISFSGNKIIEDNIITMFGLTTNREKVELLKAIHEKRTLDVLNTFESYIKRNVDLSRYVNEMLSLLKDALIYKKTNNQNLLSSSKLEDPIEASVLFSEKELLFYIDNMMKCQNEFKTTSNPSFLFEIYLLKMTNFLTETSEKVITKPVQSEPVIKKEPEIIKKHDEPIDEPIFKADYSEEIKVAPTPAPVVNQEPEEKAFNISKAKLDLPQVHLDGDTYSFDVETIIPLIVIAKKEERMTLAKVWNSLEDLLTDSDQGPYASLLLDSKPYLLTEHNLILICDYKQQAKKLNVIENQEGLAKIVKKLLGRKVCVYALNRDDSNALLTKYRNLEEISKLPLKKDIEDKKLF